MNSDNEENLKGFGFSFETGSALTKRTIMSGDLESLLEYVTDVNASISDYKLAVLEANCLKKRTIKNRGYSFSYLSRLYCLSPDFVLFRGFRYFYERDTASRPLLCLLLAYSRDSIIRSSSVYIQSLPPGSETSKSDFEERMDTAFPGRFGTKMLQSLVRNLLSSWSQSGHLTPGLRKQRQIVEPGSGAVALALLLGYLSGWRGESLLRTPYMKLLDCSPEQGIELAENASRKGWIVFKRIADVIEVTFPILINSHEMELIREQDTTPSAIIW